MAGPGIKQTYKEVKENEKSQVYLKCIAAHAISYVDGRGVKKRREYKRGEVKKRAHVRVLRPRKWQLASS